MYLKSLEIVGFKSFADKTRLEFEPGLTAIVGPNGCGKSNVSDAVRWVIGEQSAKALRGAKMEDCIFNGTDDRKPLGMAEVSLTLGECDGLSDMDFHEITVTRRVFRSGEGQYFLNKAPCRLKDIQRMFMDTGLGSASYSLMEQGRIDQVLSSRPEDRRAIFEQASGITKFKTDKQEAIRKLEHTEANLIRLADVIREVKRQIGSLQRQAGKARRYKDIRTRLRSLDIVAARDRLNTLDQDMSTLEATLTAARADIQKATAEVAEAETETTRLRTVLAQTERKAAAALEAGQHARQKLEHTREMIQVNRDRIAEYRVFSERDSREMQTLTEQAAENRRLSEDLTATIEAKERERLEAEANLRAASRDLEENRARTEEIRAALRHLRDDALKEESLAARLRNQIVEMEASERATLIQREKLLAEKAQLGRVAETYEKRQNAMSGQLETLRTHVLDQDVHLEKIEKERTERFANMQSARQQESQMKSAQAAKWAQIEFLKEAQAAGQGFSPGARLVLDETNPLNIDPARVLGALASMIQAPDTYRIPLQAVLRTWTDAVLVADRAAALDLVSKLRTRDDGAARLLALDGPAPIEPPPGPPPGRRLLDHVTVAEHARPLFERVLGGVYIIDTLDEPPTPVPPHVTLVTNDGVVVRGDGSFEVWKADRQTEDPLSRKHALDAAGQEHRNLEARIQACVEALEQTNAQWTALGQAAEEARRSLTESQRLLAQKEGEWQVVSDEAREARERFQTVSWELSNLPGGPTRDENPEKERIAKEIDTIQTRREALTATLAEQTEALHESENGQSDLQRREADLRVRFSETTQQLDSQRTRHDYMRTRLAEMDAALLGRQENIVSHQKAVQELDELIRKAESQIAELQDKDAQTHTEADALKADGRQQAEELAAMERTLAARRAALDELKSKDTDIEVHLAENRLRRQNLTERVTAAYGISLDQILTEPEPEWDGDKPDMDILETEIAELRTKLDAMGPVNLVAIEELQELEERYAFLTAQEEDLIKAKEHLLEMIRKINLTTSEMFRRTFDQINANFETMFKKLFNGGTAKLVLVNEEDILECGIEMIARPPGKRLQNISLLSGGERTLTAVALLFAIYMCKPSPFCLLDELDAALDEANISRFVKILEDFLKLSQFIVITHNRQTIAAANTLYGVTMPQKGVSKLMSMKFKDFERKATPAP